MTFSTGGQGFFIYLFHLTVFLSYASSCRRPDDCRLTASLALSVARMRTRALQPKWRKLVTPSTPDTDYQVVAAVGGRTSAHTNGRTKCRINPFCECFTPNPRNVQASRKNFTASHKILTASRKCFTVGRNFLVSPLVRL